MGWSVIGFGVVAAGLGWWHGWLEFRAIGFFTIFLFATAFLATVRRASLEAEIELHQPRVQAGALGLGRVVLRGGRAGSPAAMIELPVGKARARFRVSALGTADEHEELFSIPTRKRGVVAIGPVRTVKMDPLMLLRRSKILSDQAELFIHPKTVRLDVTAIGFLKDVEGVTTAKLSSSDVSFHALRQYVPGDDRRAVHWKTTARTGKLMVRQFEETMRAHLLLLLSTMRADYADEQSFETAVSAVASLGVAALREERQVTVYTSAGPLFFHNPVGLLDSLCRVGLQDGGPNLRQLALRAGKETLGVSVAGMVTGAIPRQEILAAQLVLPAQLQIFAIRSHNGGEINRSEAAGVTILDLPDLAHLSRLIRSLA